CMKTTKRFQHLASTVLPKAAASLLLASGFLLPAWECRGQGTLTITFDGPPHLEPGGPGWSGAEYVESNMQFTGQVSRFLGPYFAFPYNGTAYLQTFPSLQVAF